MNYNNRGVVSRRVSFSFAKQASRNSHLPPQSRGVVWTGASVVGVPVWGEHGSALGAGLQGYPTAAKLSGAVGGLAGQRGHSSAEALRAAAQLPQGGPAVPTQVVLLQVAKQRQTQPNRLEERLVHIFFFFMGSLRVTVRWSSGTWPYEVLRASVLFTWSACFTTSTCSTWWSIGWLKLRERLLLASWARYVITAWIYILLFRWGFIFFAQVVQSLYHAS